MKRCLLLIGLQPTASNLNPLRLAQILEEILPKDSILIADGGDFVATASYILRPRGIFSKPRLD